MTVLHVVTLRSQPKLHTRASLRPYSRSMCLGPWSGSGLHLGKLVTADFRPDDLPDSQQWQSNKSKIYAHFICAEVIRQAPDLIKHFKILNAERHYSRNVGNHDDVKCYTTISAIIKLYNTSHLASNLHSPQAYDRLLAYITIDAVHCMHTDQQRSNDTQLTLANANATRAGK